MKTERTYSSGTVAATAVAMVLASGGCSEADKATVARLALWDACELLPDHESLEVADGVVGKTEGAMDFDWPRVAYGGADFRVAESRCSYTVSAGASDDSTIALSARLSARDDRSARDLKELLAAEGYPKAIDLDVDCANAAFWTAFPSGTDGPGRGELHMLLSWPPLAPAAACRAPLDGELWPASLFAHAVLFVPNSTGEALPIAKKMAFVVRDQIVVAMESIAERTLFDGPDSGMGEVDAAPDMSGGTDVDETDAAADAAIATPEGGLPLDEVPAAVADAWCGRLYECCSEEELSAGSIANGPLSRCVFKVSATLNLTLAAAKTALDADHVTYDSAAAAACIAALKVQDCAALLTQNAETPCLSTALTPQVANKQPCTSDLECADGHCEVPDSPEAEANAGLCVARAPDGAPCESDASCAGDRCDEQGLCATRKARPWCAGL